MVVEYVQCQRGGCVFVIIILAYFNKMFNILYEKTGILNS